ncbi:ABC transporter substrate-binding protein [Kitasatospora sp. NPDC085879]|uniref:ABC transporter substrate-binding protein n=1 Tax=Kitasatospora sp. NPDC085879 TaxID=3154769 RepID=UPI0034315649
MLNSSLPRRARVPGRALAAAGAAGLLLSGCASSASPASDGSSDLRDRVPKAVRKAGVLRIGSYLNYAPVDFKESDGRPAGLDPDLAAAIGKLLGLRIEFVDMPFDRLIPAVQSRDVDLAMSAVIDTTYRQNGIDDQGHTSGPGVDFVDYFFTSTSILVKAGNPARISGLDSLCGHAVAVQKGTVQAEIVNRQAGACSRYDRKLEVHELATDELALAQVEDGTAVADLNDYPVAQYNTSAERGGRFELTGGHIQSSPYAITVNKADTELRTAVAKALDRLIRDGEYDRILDRWGLHTGEVSSAVVNGGR